MIKFRKGSLIPKPALPESTVSPVVSAIPATSSQSNSWQPEQVVNLEWWQTPTKFKRRLVDDLEADLINVRYLVLLEYSHNIYYFFTEWRS